MPTERTSMMIFKSGTSRYFEYSSNNEYLPMPKIWPKIKNKVVQLACLKTLFSADSGNPKIQFRVPNPSPSLCGTRHYKLKHTSSALKKYDVENLSLISYLVF